MINVYSSQYNYSYGSQLHFPYSIAILVSYLKSKKEFNSKIWFQKTFVVRKDLQKHVDSIVSPDILLCSCYVWNWEITNKLAKSVKEKYPHCLIIYGGPQVPDRDYGFFNQYPWVDLLVHNEGEIVLSNVFREFIEEKKYESIKGVTTRKTLQWTPEERITDINIIPSPYSTELIWDLVNKDDAEWIASWERNRGCPFQCTFCDWGSSTYQKTRRFEVDRLDDEVEWFGKNGIVYIDMCDANYGIFKEDDFHSATKLSEVTAKYGFPQTVRQSWVKASSEKIIPIAKELKKAGLLTAVGLAVESLDPTTLEIIKRKNIKFETFSELTKIFEQEGLPTYTELIRGLPGETLQSFKNGLEILLKDSRIGAIYIYSCSVLPNAPMNDPAYIKSFSIKTVKSPIYLAHSSINDRDIQEYEEIVVSTSTCNKEDMYEMYLYSWCVLCLHNFGILEWAAHYCKRELNISYMDFYGKFLEFCRNNPDGIFGKELTTVLKYIENGYAGNGWDHYDENLGPIFWPIEEATWLRLSYHVIEYEIQKFLEYIKCEHNIARDLASFCSFLLSKRNCNVPTSARNFYYNWIDYFNGSKLVEDARFYYFKNKLTTWSDDFDWNKQAIWYGRRSCKYKTKLSEIALHD